MGLSSDQLSLNVPGGTGQLPVSDVDVIKLTDITAGNRGANLYLVYLTEAQSVRIDNRTLAPIWVAIWLTNSTTPFYLQIAPYGTEQWGSTYTIDHINLSNITAAAGVPQFGTTLNPANVAPVTAGFILVTSLNTQISGEPAGYDNGMRLLDQFGNPFSASNPVTTTLVNSSGQSYGPTNPYPMTIEDPAGHAYSATNPFPTTLEDPSGTAYSATNPFSVVIRPIGNVGDFSGSSSSITGLTTVTTINIATQPISLILMMSVTGWVIIRSGLANGYVSGQLGGQIIGNHTLYSLAHPGIRFQILLDASGNGGVSLGPAIVPVSMAPESVWSGDSVLNLQAGASNMVASGIVTALTDFMVWAV